ncbi:sugar ABC transporter ATP-binding protein [Arthrobacter globiformis]|uniref:Sugar ABC transporter ATP-binding protein n=1 Tax=Arthrobacter globiformis TaxID=1665 RepID=A0A328HPD0_ARTGO|nr:sugar ABC transporter ATP-binding protein [Arthrobacter globiformis]RAM38873.1 sugar ABC transporter ATP-binding protein [Arthrobacter globiformis]
MTLEAGHNHVGAVAVKGRDETLIKVTQVSKKFGGVHALKGIDLEVNAGEVNALLGENGAGKSTLIKIIAGAMTADGGSIEIAGREHSFKSPAESRAAGLAVVYQELSLIPSLSVAANLFLGREPRNRLGLVNRRKLLRDADEFLDSYGFPLDSKARVSDLPFAYRQMTEISKALIGDVRVLVLDEPTSALTSGEEEILFSAVERVTARGVGVIYVTHRLKEVFRISHRVTILRDGRNAATMLTKDVDMDKLVAEIVGPNHNGLKTAVASDNTLSQPGHGNGVSSSSSPIFQLKAVSNDRLRGVDLEVREGEIHGLAGSIGSGRTEILETVFGLRKIKAGTMSMDGKEVSIKSPYEAIAKGIALAPEDRHEEGLILDQTIEQNLALPRLKGLTRYGWFLRKASKAQANLAMQTLSVKAPASSVRVKNLSGGNQQKVVFAKWFPPVPKLLLLDEPTVGVDVGAREEIYGVVRDIARSGSAVLVASSDLLELMILCDRISIVADGRVVTTVNRSELIGEEELHRLIQQSHSFSKELS